MLSRRFDRDGAIRLPFLSAMAMMGAKDGERGSYPEIVMLLLNTGLRGRRTPMPSIGVSPSMC
jgi:serine/threonine-protein kinase HipA